MGIYMRCPKFRHLALLLLLLAGLSPAQAKPGRHPPFETTGTVIKIPDGDTIRLDTSDHGVLDVRLSGADTPEKGQAYWKAARGYLRSLVAGQTTTVWCYKRDRYDREVCHVRVGSRDLGEALIAEGYAWYPLQFSGELTLKQRQSYQLAAEQARVRKTGIWQEPDPMPPWECRKYKRAGNSQLCR